MYIENPVFNKRKKFNSLGSKSSKQVIRQYGFQRIQLSNYVAEVLNQQTKNQQALQKFRREAEIYKKNKIKEKYHQFAVNEKPKQNLLEKEIKNNSQIFHQISEQKPKFKNMINLQNLSKEQDYQSQINRLHRKLAIKDLQLKNKDQIIKDKRHMIAKLLKKIKISTERQQKEEQIKNIKHDLNEISRKVSSNKNILEQVKNQKINDPEKPVQMKIKQGQNRKKSQKLPKIYYPKSKNHYELNDKVIH